MKLSAPQRKALKMLSFGVSINLRRIFTKQTVARLIEAGLILEHHESFTREHALTFAGAEALREEETR